MSDKMSDRDRMRDLAVTLRDGTIAKEERDASAINRCWDWLFQLLEVKDGEAR